MNKEKLKELTSISLRVVFIIVCLVALSILTSLLSSISTFFFGENHNKLLFLLLFLGFIVMYGKAILKSNGTLSQHLASLLMPIGFLGILLSLLAEELNLFSTEAQSFLLIFGGMIFCLSIGGTFLWRVDHAEDCENAKSDRIIGSIVCGIVFVGMLHTLLTKLGVLSAGTPN